ncbi:MAG: hypothetical protein PHV32_10890 [Eubacteriales bacterium]|nr:hypothetical protein [Eubacteriales bacterium]
MNKDIQTIIDYLVPLVIDPFPRYIFKREILREPPTPAEIDAIHTSKWHKQLADEQSKDGSWGRFHSMDSRIANKQKFVSTEAALRRLRELGLPKDDPVVAKCIKLMERYIREEEAWPDYVEKHKDNGRGFIFCRPFLTAANLNLFDPENPVIKPLRDVVAETIKTAFSDGCFNEAYWKQKVSEYHVPSIAHPGIAYSPMLLQSVDCMDDTLQRQYLNYIWDKQDGIYYISNFAVSKKHSLEDKKFTTWLSSLELLIGFSLFPEYMKEDVCPYLTSEVRRIMADDVTLPPAHPITGHYAESWRDKNARKNDLILRILRILVKC